MKPILSIPTTTYNQAKFISRCINGILSQTFPNYEQIIIVDGSTDGTEEIIKKFKDERVIYIRQKHKVFSI